MDNVTPVENLKAAYSRLCDRAAKERSTLITLMEDDGYKSFLEEVKELQKNVDALLRTAQPSDDYDNLSDIATCDDVFANLLDELRKEHGDLYQNALKDPSSLDQNKVDRLLKYVSDFSKLVRSLEDYRRLSDMAIAWQVFFSSNFNRPKAIQLSPPVHGLISMRPRKALLEEELGYWIGRNAEYLAVARLTRTGMPSTQQEKDEDWKQATVFLASDVLQGRINFASRLSAGSYYRLENVWVEDVKRLRAYFKWEERGKGFGGEKENYYPACHELREMLVNPEIKALPTEFGEPKRYLEERYLVGGKVTEEKPTASELIRTKAARIAQETGRTDQFLNWITATTYVKMFYQNIIPAIVESKPENIRAVLRAFQFSRAPGKEYDVVSAFEGALAIYFLDREIINQLWAEQRPESLESIVSAPGWPKTFEVPKECEGQFSFDGRVIQFEGVMTNEQKDALRKTLDSQYAEAVETLFARSRFIDREATL